MNRFAELAESGICKIIDVGRKMTAIMDNVRGSLGIDGICAGLNLPHGYDGSGVVVGFLRVAEMSISILLLPSPFFLLAKHLLIFRFQFGLQRFRYGFGWKEYLGRFGVEMDVALA